MNVVEPLGRPKRCESKRTAPNHIRRRRTERRWVYIHRVSKSTPLSACATSVAQTPRQSTACLTRIPFPEKNTHPISILPERRENSSDLTTQRAPQLYNIAITKQHACGANLYQPGELSYTPALRCSSCYTCANTLPPNLRSQRRKIRTHLWRRGVVERAHTRKIMQRTL